MAVYRFVAQTARPAGHVGRRAGRHADETRYGHLEIGIGVGHGRQVAGRRRLIAGRLGRGRHRQRYVAFTPAYRRAIIAI